MAHRLARKVKTAPMNDPVMKATTMTRSRIDRAGKEHVAAVVVRHRHQHRLVSAGVRADDGRSRIAK